MSNIFQLAPMSLMISISGIRGVVGESLTPDVAVKYAAAFGEYCKRPNSRNPEVILGRDGRATGKIIANIFHNVSAPHPAGMSGGFGLAIQVFGTVSNGKGKSVRIQIRFAFPDGRILIAHPKEPAFRNPSNWVTTGSALLPIRNDHLDLATVGLDPIPYYVLNLAATNYSSRYDLLAVAELFVNGTMIAESYPFSFFVAW